MPFNKINDLGALFFILNPISKLYTIGFFHEISHTKTNDVSHDCIVIHTFHRSIQKESDHHFRISKMLTFGWFLRTSILQVFYQVAFFLDVCCLEDIFICSGKNHVLFRGCFLELNCLFDKQSKGNYLHKRLKYNLVNFQIPKNHFRRTEIRNLYESKSFIQVRFLQ